MYWNGEEIHLLYLGSYVRAREWSNNRVVLSSEYRHGGQMIRRSGCR